MTQPTAARLSEHLTEDQSRTGYLVGLLGIAVLTAALIPLRPHLELTGTGFLFLAAVAVIAACWGRGPGLAASVVANLCYNFFFVPPLHRFTVQNASNVVTLLVFLFVATLTSALLARARAGEAAARRHVQETAILYDLSRLIVAEVDLPATLASVCRQLAATFGARSCSAWLVRDAALVQAAYVGEPEPDTLSTDDRRTAEEALTTGRITVLGGGPGRRMPRIIGRTGRGAPVAFIPLRVGGRSVGLLRVVGQLQARVFTANELRLLEAFADEVAPAVERDRLLHEAARAEALAETDRLKSALLSAVSHDLRTPLASIKASASSLLQEEVEWDAATRREFLMAIDEETDRLSRLVANLLDLSRIEGGALRPEIEPYNIAELLETVVARLSRTVTGHRLVLDLAPDTGDAPLDYVQIAQVLTNLVENAAKFAPEGTTITVAARHAGETVEVSVADQGPGIPAAERERVFDKFYRVSGTAGKPGTGLGLAISKGLVEAHGGKIRIEEAEGGGARFVLALPAAVDAASPVAPAAEGASRYERRSRVRPRAV